VADLKALGNAQLQQGDAKQAAVSFTKALQLEPHNAVLLSNRSAAFLKMGRASRALQDADDCLRLDPSWLKAHYRRLQALRALGADADSLLQTARAALLVDATAVEFIDVIRKHDPVAYRAQYAAAPPAPPAPAPAAPAAPPAPPVPVVRTRRSPIHESFVQNAKFATAPNMPEVVLEFARKTLDELMQQFDDQVVGAGATAAQAKLRSTVFFLPLDDIPLPVISVDEAFSNPELLHRCVAFLREAAQRDKILGACTVVQRSAVSFPQVWRGRDRTEFPFDDAVDGIFIMIESATTEGAAEFVGQRIVHFMPMVADDSGVVRVSRADVVALDPDLFALMPRLLK
jgi:tetratricopeptide (TPR) repeat protein